MKKPLFITALSKQFEKPLPGKKAHLQKAHPLRALEAVPDEKARKASVLVLLFPKKMGGRKEWHLVLTERALHIGDKHSGQMSFPGGGYQVSDGTLPDGLWQCALREAREEVQIDPTKVHFIGQMSDLYISVSKYQVFPYLAWSAAPFDWEPQASEVKTIYEVPLSHLKNPDNLKITEIWISERLTLPAVPYYDVYGKKVWGATAMILAELLDMIGN